MAFGQGKDSGNTGGSFKKYVGIGTVKIVAVNPTLEEFNKITKSNLTKAPEYTLTASDGTKQARLMLLMQVKPEKTIGNLDVIIPVNFWFKKAAIQGKTSGKFRVIDKYGRTAWASQEDIDAKRIPQYSNGPADLDENYRKLAVGEEAFTNFLKAHLGIPALTYVDSKTGQTIKNENPSNCEARLDNLSTIFDGDFTEIKKIINYRKDNYSKMLFGVRTTDDGKEFQDVFMDRFLTEGTNNNTYFAKAYAKATQGDYNSYPHTYFGDLNPNGELILTDLHEYTVTPTTFTQEDGNSAPGTQEGEANDDLPF